MSNVSQWNDIFKELSEGLLIADLNKPASAFDLFTSDQVGTAIDSGPSEIPMRYMRGSIKLSKPVSKAKHRTYLDWAASAGDRA